jgi:protein-S-isoprenylcysteine O-methyltransferase Ste14
MRDAERFERPNSVPWPPLILLSAVAAGIALGAFFPLNVEFHIAVRLAGFLLLVAGGAIDLSAGYTMWRARTNILPHKPALRLITSGPFRFTRNPIYLANSIALAGIALAFSNLWFIVAAASVTLLVDRLAIRREEAHLAARFGAEWDAYAARTPRWIV